VDTILSRLFSVQLVNQMLTTHDFLQEIQALNYQAKTEIYEFLKQDLWRNQKRSIDIKKYQGIAKNVWADDAQQHIDELRNNDRF
jgi:hypothetical protein